MTRKSRAASLAALGALLVGAAAGCGRQEPNGAVPAPAPEARSRETLLAEFRGLCESMREGRDPYFGLAQVEELRDWASRPVDDPTPRAVVRARLGMELLRIGQEDEAVRWLGEAREIAERAGLDEPLRLDITRRLALAQLRLGEQRNCVARHGPASCIFPLDAGGVHVDPSGAAAAVELYRSYLKRQPDQPTVRWLLNLAAMAAGSFPDEVPAAWRIPPARLRSQQQLGRFRDEAAQRGIRLVRPSGGAVLDDFDGDGDLDLVTSTIDPCASMSYFRNRGDGSFEERTVEANLDVQLGGLNLIHGDYDNDGHLDLLVLRGGWLGGDGRMRNSLLRNRGDGSFDDVTHAAGLAAAAYPTQTAAFADYDLDGDLDVFIGNESDQLLYEEGLGDESRAYPSQLFRNEGDGTFTDVAEQAGVVNRRFAKGVAWGDYDDDGDPDLYVSNIGRNRLYRNDGDGTFTDVAEDAGVTEPAGRSFPTWFFDFDNDGDLDIFVAHYGASLDEVAAYLLEGRPSGQHPRLYRNDGPAGFREIARTVGLDAPSLAMGANFGDLDEDGFPDIYLGTGSPSFESISPNRMYRNDGGRRFADVTFSGGFGHLQKGHGIAFGDVDGDGDQDVFEQMGGAYPGDAYPSVLYVNPGRGRHWVTLRLTGVRSNRSAIGARLRLTVSTPAGPRTIHAEVGSGGSFGGSSLQQEIGLGDATRVEAAEVRWPGGQVQALGPLEVDRVYVVREGDPPRAVSGGSR